MVKRLSHRVEIMIAFLIGVVFSNAVNSIITGEVVFAIFSFIIVGTVVMLKRFVDWTIYGDEEIDEVAEKIRKKRYKKSYF
ncbi:hypothetical protein ACFLQN_02260 [Candidatus Aenigmatarchaeota archaeon]